MLIDAPRDCERPVVGLGQFNPERRSGIILPARKNCLHIDPQRAEGPLIEMWLRSRPVATSGLNALGC